MKTYCKRHDQFYEKHEGCNYCLPIAASTKQATTGFPDLIPLNQLTVVEVDEASSGTLFLTALATYAAENRDFAGFSLPTGLSILFSNASSSSFLEPILAGLSLPKISLHSIGILSLYAPQIEFWLSATLPVKTIFADAGDSLNDAALINLKQLVRGTNKALTIVRKSNQPSHRSIADTLIQLRFKTGVTQNLGWFMQWTRGNQQDTYDVDILVDPAKYAYTFTARHTSSYTSP